MVRGGHRAQSIAGQPRRACVNARSESMFACGSGHRGRVLASYPSLHTHVTDGQGTHFLTFPQSQRNREKKRILNVQANEKYNSSPQLWRTLAHLHFNGAAET